MEPADALGTNDVLWPATGHKLIEQTKIQGRTTVVDKRPDAILLRLAFIVVVVMVMMVVVMFMLFIMFMVMVLIFVFVVMVVLLIVLMMMVFLVVVVIILIMFVLLISMMILNLVNPCCRSCHTVEIEHTCVQDLL